MSRDIIIGIDAGTSVIKSVAFDLTGRQLDVAATPNRYDTGPDRAVTQPLDRTWADCAATLRQLTETIPDLPSRVVAIAVTGQGDGTWLVGRDNQPVGDGWLWLDARAAELAEDMTGRDGDAARYLSTGTGLNGCQQGVQLAYMKTHMPEALERAECAMHCKDWLYLNLTGQRVTDPTEGSFTFGDFRTRAYNDDVLAFLGLTDQRRLLPPICDGATNTHGLSRDAATATGLPAGTPVALGYVDIVCTTLGGGGYLPGQRTGCTIVGTTGVHIGCKANDDVQLNPEERTGYVMPLPIAGQAAHLQTNMAGTMNIDWVLGLAQDVCATLGREASQSDLLAHVDRWMADSTPGSLIYHPHISEAGERGPFIDQNARSNFIGLSTAHGFADLVRGAVEGLAMASRDCYNAMGPIPDTVTLTGGAARSDSLRATLAATLGASVRRSSRAEAGAAGAAMMAAVSTGVYADMSACIQDWVAPTLSAPESPDPELCARYDQLYPLYVDARKAISPIWRSMAQYRNAFL